MYINGVLEGGGIKGLAYIGALQFLEERGVQFYKMAGVSIGALVAALVKCGYRAEELKKIVDEINMRDILTNERSFFGGVFQSVKHKGLYSIDNLEKMVHELLLKKGYETFADLKVGEDYLLKMIVTDVKRKRMLTLPKDLALYHINPDTFPISKAVAMSCTMPLLFYPYPLAGDYFFDGGVSNNFPITIFSKESIKTVGFRLGKYQLKNKEGIVKKMQNKTFQIPLYEQEQDLNTVFIDTFHIRATSFKLGFEAREALYQAGYIATREFFYQNMFRGYC